MRRRSLFEIFHAAKAESGRTLKRRPGIYIVEHKKWLVPSSSKNKTFVTGGVPAPFFGISCHIIGAKAAHALITSHGCEPLSREVAERKNVGVIPDACSITPMVHIG